MYKRLSTLLISLLLMSLLLSLGCVSGNSESKNAVGEADTPLDNQVLGALILSVNPKVEISYNLNGLVVDLKGLNEDGEKIVSAYGEYLGQTCREVTCGLIEKMQKAGYFRSDNGEQKNIVLQLAAGSLCPNDDFLETVTDGVKKTVSGLADGENITLNLPLPSPTPQPLPSPTPQPQSISLEQAKEIALAYGLFGEGVQVEFTKEKLDKDVYELEFRTDTHEYEAEISLTGQVLKFEAETLAPDALPETQDFITLEAAKKIALEHAGLANKSGAVFVKEEFDRREGKYELEILWGGYEYEIDVNAATGAILKSEKEAAKGTAPDMSLRKITLEEAKALVLKDLNLKEAVFDKEEYDAYEEEYELELTVNGFEYEYTVSAYDGTILKRDWDNKEMAKATPAPQADSSFIGTDKAKSLALKHAGLAGKSVSYKEAKLDKDDGRYVYEIEFVYEGMEYEYEVDALTGKILKSEKEKAD